jgi:cytochrome c oxidase cbb3-type subunit 3
MRPALSLMAASFVGSMAVLAAAQGAASAAAQGAGPAAAQVPAGGRGGAQSFPAQQRPPGDPAVVARGGGLYGVHCRACHGTDLRGGDIGGPNLLRSQIALNDQDGELIGPVITVGKQTPGQPAMPAIPLPPDDLKAIAAYVHSVQATMRGQGSPPAGPPVALNILVGDAAAGEAYFTTNCSRCHTAAGDLRAIGSRVPDPTQLQNLWVAGGRGGRAGGPPNPQDRRQVMVTVTLANGQKVEGRLDRIDDFLVLLTTADGSQRSFSRNNEVPIVEVRDPLEAHRRLLGVYADRDIHNVTAYLVTLK